MHRSNMEDSGGWSRYWYEQTGVPQAAQIRRSPSETVSQVPTLHQCCRPASAPQVVMPSILSHSESPSTAVPVKAGLKQAESRDHFKPEQSEHQPRSGANSGRKSGASSDR